VAFAANSVLCRLALGPGAIDAASFTTVRVAAGAATLALILKIRSRGSPLGLRPHSSWAPAALFLYAACFSFAYVSLSTGTGALILFGAVQITMMVAALRGGERPSTLAWLGYTAAAGGMIFLVAPGVEAPSLRGALLMALAGFGWGVYSLLGRGSASPLSDSAKNFLFATPLALVGSGLFWSELWLTQEGAVLALVSGAFTSGLGYVIWYAALRGLSAARAAVVQLSVPVIAAAGGVVFSAETISWRLVTSAALILGGIALAIRR
jgi:drug/metabolite transporter (DMT)-like permease